MVSTLEDVSNRLVVVSYQADARCRCEREGGGRLALGCAGDGAQVEGPVPGGISSHSRVQVADRERE